MNCELAHERIVMAAYGELPDDATHELDRHLAACNGCAEERDQMRAIKILADAYPVQEVPANLVARSRIRLEEALDALPPKRWFERVFQRVRNSAATLQSAPVAAALVLVMGAAGGGLTSYLLEFHRAAKVTEAADTKHATPEQATANLEVANISSITRQPNTEQVEVRYNQLVPREVRGSLDDPEIRRLLMLASENAVSTPIRDDSVGLLASECRAGHGCQGTGEVRDVLMIALRYDRNAGVRHKALEGLQPYVAEDTRVRDAVLEALLNDSDPHIRTDAINILEPVEADTSVRQVLQSVATTDRNPRIRLVSRQVLSRVPEIQ